MQDKADQDGPDTAEEVSPEDAKHAEPNQSVGDDLPGRSGDPDARFLFPAKTPDNRFQDATTVERIARQQVEQRQDQVDVGQPFRRCAEIATVAEALVEPIKDGGEDEAGRGTNCGDAKLGARGLRLTTNLSDAAKDI